MQFLPGWDLYDYESESRTGFQGRMGKAEEQDWMAEYGLCEESLRIAVGGD